MKSNIRKQLTFFVCMFLMCIGLTFNSDVYGIDYIKGRPLTEEEIEEQKAMVPKNNGLLELPEDFKKLLEKKNTQSTFAVNDLKKDSNGKWDIFGKGFSIVPSAAVFEPYYNSVDEGYVTGVKNQEAYQWCWAYSLMSAAETSMIKNNIKVNGNESTIYNTDLSEAAFVYFTYRRNQYNDPLSNTEGDYIVYTGDDFGEVSQLSGFSGNTMQSAYVLSQWIGMSDEEFYTPEDLSDNKTPDISGLPDVQQGIITDFCLVENDISKIKECIKKYGSVVMDYNSDMTYYNYDTAAWCNKSGDLSTDHATVIVGWDDNYSKDNFLDYCNVTNDGAWIVKNSWGSDWGDGGYFYMSYEDKTMKPAVSIKVENKEKYHNNYYYDGACNMNLERVNNGGKIANIYEVKGNKQGEEYLKAVSFAEYAGGCSYSIQIYKNLQNPEDPESGQAQLDVPVKGTAGEAGMHTIDINQNILLKSGENFSVVITLENQNVSEIDYAVEEPWDYGWYSCFTATNANQSFSCNSDGKWRDLSNTNESARIKAYTNNVTKKKVEFVLDGKIVDTQYVYENSAAKLPDNLHKKGHELKADKSIECIDKDTTVNLSWVKCKYTLTINANGGLVNGKKTDSRTVTYMDKYGYLPTAKRDGYELVGWYNKRTGGNEVTADTEYKQVKNSTVYAIWKAKSYTVKFDGNGGKMKSATGNGMVKTRTKKVAFKTKMGNQPKPERKGYKFAGWYTDKKYKTRVYSTSIFKQTKNITLYAKWVKIQSE